MPNISKPMPKTNLKVVSFLPEARLIRLAIDEKYARNILKEFGYTERSAGMTSLIVDHRYDFEEVKNYLMELEKNPPLTKLEYLLQRRPDLKSAFDHLLQHGVICWHFAEIYYAESATHILANAFMWEKSPQGKAFWQEVYNQFRAEE